MLLLFFEFCHASSFFPCWHQFFMFVKSCWCCNWDVKLVDDNSSNWHHQFDGVMMTSWFYFSPALSWTLLGVFIIHINGVDTIWTIKIEFMVGEHVINCWRKQQAVGDKRHELSKLSHFLPVFCWLEWCNRWCNRILSR